MAELKKETKEQLEILLSDYVNIFSKHMTDPGKTYIIEMSLQPKASMNPLDQTPYTPAFQHNAWIKWEMTDFERAGIISSFTSNLTCPIIIVPKKKEPTTTYRMVVDFRQISQKLEYWSYPLMRIDWILLNYMKHESFWL